MPKVFISYSHDSDEHRDFVRAISNRMRDEGLECQIDQYITGSPPEGWHRWMEKQIEQVDFVLLVCTPNYLKRYRGEEREGGRGVAFEGIVISQTLYNNYYHNTKFIPVIPANGSLDHVPVPLQSYSCYSLPLDYDKLYRVLSGQAEYVAPKLGSIRIMPAANVESPKRIHSDRLPTVKGEFFGRAVELKLLNDAWVGGGTRIIQFIAPGGTGKTKLLRHWLDYTNDFDALIAWSFYSQGASEDKQVSATPFFSHAFEKLGSTCATFATEEAKGEHLADLLCQQRCVLVLDGLEPLQHAGKGMLGELKDKAIHQLLKSLMRHNDGLCVITTRIKVPELSDRVYVITHDLQNLSFNDGVKLLQSLGVVGKVKELEQAVREYGHHALALHLLGNALHTYLDGDVRKRDTLTELIGDYDGLERHAFKVMQAYSIWLAGTPELQLLQLLGLFDHPIETEVLQVLWKARIPALTANIDEKAWKVAIRDLREQHRLLAIHPNQSDLLDCHPLIREYFGRQLHEKQPDAWRQAHIRIYEYYKALPKKKFPDTLEEMQPLFSAVAHGCAGGLYQQAFVEIYLQYILRGGESGYIFSKLGAFSDSLAVLAHFYISPWHTIATSLPRNLQAAVQGYVGYSLRGLGRLHEALIPMQIAVGDFAKLEVWMDAAVSAINLSELQLTLGNIDAALIYGQKSVDYAKKSKWDIKNRAKSRAAFANIQYQAGNMLQAIILFNKAEQLQKKMEPSLLRLYSLPGFCYCELLLEQGKETEVLERAEYDLDLWTNHYKGTTRILDLSLPKLTLGRVHLQQRNFTRAAHWLDQAIDGLRAYGSFQHLPRGLLARAALHRNIFNPDLNFTCARQDLQEVFDIAEPSGMRLHLTDYHLEMARLLIAERENPSQSPSGNDGLSIQAHVTKATKLIEETGYKRRLPELEELRKIINEKPFG